MGTFFDKKETVKLVQRYLSEILERRDIADSGIYDERTRDAVIQYQRGTGLEVSGIVDRITYEKMYADWLKKTKTAKFNRYAVGDYSPNVKIIKSLLRRLWRYYPDTEGFDDNSMFGEDLEEEIRRMRLIMGLAVSGEFDSEMYDRIIKELKIRENSSEAK